MNEYLYLKFYFMNRSVASRASNASSKMLEELANRSQTKYTFINHLGSKELKAASMTKK